MKYIVIFHTFSGVMAFERILKKRKMAFESMPAPRHLSTDCGVSTCFETEDIEGFIASVSTENIHRVYLVEGENYVKVFENE